MANPVKLLKGIGGLLGRSKKREPAGEFLERKKKEGLQLTNEEMDMMLKRLQLTPEPTSRVNPAIIAGGATAAALASPDAEAGGLLQMIKAAKIARQRLADEIAARWGDAPSSSVPQRREERRLQEMDDEIEQMQGQLSGVSPRDMEWGTTRGASHIQDIMDRYRGKHGVDYNPKDLVADPPRQADLFHQQEQLRRAEAHKRQSEMNQVYGDSQYGLDWE